MQVLTLLLLLDFLLERWFLVVVFYYSFLLWSYSFSCLAVACVLMLIRGDKRQKVSMACLQVGGGEQGIFPQGPQTFKGPHEAFIFMILPLWAAFSHLSFAFPALSGLNEQHLGRIISNAFTVSVDKLFDACKHLEPTSLINWPCLYN